ncbi:hypothetical protein EHLJMEHL_02085 [Vreelandella titanicae]
MYFARIFTCFTLILYCYFGLDKFFHWLWLSIKFNSFSNIIYINKNLAILYIAVGLFLIISTHWYFHEEYNVYLKTCVVISLFVISVTFLMLLSGRYHA